MSILNLIRHNLSFPFSWLVSVSIVSKEGEEEQKRVRLVSKQMITISKIIFLIIFFVKAHRMKSNQHCSPLTSFLADCWEKGGGEIY